MAEGVVLPQTEPGSQPHSLEEPERFHVPPEPPVGPRLPGARVRGLLRKVLRRKRFPSAVLPAAFDASPTTTSDDTPREPHGGRKPVRLPADSPVAQPPDRRRPVNETGPTPAHPSPPVADHPERPARPSKVVEFEAPIRRPTVSGERTARRDRPVTAGAARPPAAEPLHAELLLDVGGTERVPEQAVAPLAPRRESDAEHVREPAIQRPIARLESSLQAFRGRRDESLSAEGIDRWPELPPPLDLADGEVEVAVRAWERQQRLDREQTRL